MQVVVDSDKPADQAKFVRVYKTCVLCSLNTRRSTCEQSAAEVVKEQLREKGHIDEVNPPPYSVEMLCKALPVQNT
jgi:hypothetical protein